MRIKIVSFAFLLGVFLIHPVKTFSHSLADSSYLLKVYEDSMKSLQYVRIYARTDAEKAAANSKMISLMNKALLLRGSFDYPFDSLTTIGKVTSPDKQFRLITWDVPKSGCRFGYYGFLQSYNTKKKKYDVFVLEDHSDDIGNAKTAVCTPNKWIGMLYYKIIREKESGIYTLLAWQGYDKLITRKVIDILTFNTQGIPSFGKSIYAKLPASFKGNPKRIVFEYSAQVSMSLRYDESKNRILFDHLGPIEGGLQGQYQYYGPSFQVDALYWKNGEWSYEANVEARNANDKGDKMFNDPQHPTHQENSKAIYNPPH